MGARRPPAHGRAARPRAAGRGTRPPSDALLGAGRAVGLRVRRPRAHAARDVRGRHVRPRADGARGLDPARAARRRPARGDGRAAHAGAAPPHPLVLRPARRPGHHRHDLLGDHRLGRAGRDPDAVCPRAAPRSRLRPVRARPSALGPRRAEPRPAHRSGPGSGRHPRGRRARPPRAHGRDDGRAADDVRAGRALQAHNVAGRHRRNPAPLAPGPRRPRARPRAAALHGARAGVPRGEHRRRPDRAPAPPRLPAREARDPAPHGGGRPRDDRGRAVGRPARHRALHPHPRRRAEDQAARLQRRPVLRPRRVRGHLRRRGPPEAAQLRDAVAAFRQGGDDLVCVQAAAELLQRPPERAHAHVHARVLVLVRLHAARASTGSGCRSRSAARPTTSAPTGCAASAAGTRSTSPRTPTWACGRRPRATRLASSPRRRSRRRARR